MQTPRHLTDSCIGFNLHLYRQPYLRKVPWQTLIQNRIQALLYKDLTDTRTYPKQTPIRIPMQLSIQIPIAETLQTPITIPVLILSRHLHRHTLCLLHSCAFIFIWKTYRTFCSTVKRRLQLICGPTHTHTPRHSHAYTHTLLHTHKDTHTPDFVSFPFGFKYIPNRSIATTRYFM